MAAKPLRPEMRGAVQAALSNAIRDRLAKCAGELQPLMAAREFRELNLEMTALLIAFETHCVGDGA